MNYERMKLGAMFILGVVLSMSIYACERNPILPDCPPGIEVSLESGTYVTDSDKPYVSKDFDGPVELTREALTIKVDRGAKTVTIESAESDFVLELKEQ